MSALHAVQVSSPPPPDLQLHLIGDNDEVLDKNCQIGSRRPSTVSLSRIRSCPQLPVLTNNGHDSPCIDMAPITDKQGNIIHTCPALRHNLFVDIAEVDIGGIRSVASTPTPPSTPESKRKYVIISSFTSKFQTPDNEVVSSFTPLQIQSTICSVPTHMDSPVHSQAEYLDGWEPLGNDNLQLCEKCFAANNGSSVELRDYNGRQLDDEIASDGDAGSSLHVIGRLPNQIGRDHCCNYLQETAGDDSIDKCSRWLQSLHINAADKMKSRSHIQLSTA